MQGRPRRVPSRSPPPRRPGAAQLLAAAAARREAAEKAAAERERATATARGKLAGQEEADRAALEVRVCVCVWCGMVCVRLFNVFFDICCAHQLTNEQTPVAA